MKGKPGKLSEGSGYSSKKWNSWEACPNAALSSSTDQEQLMKASRFNGVGMMNGVLRVVRNFVQEEWYKRKQNLILISLRCFSCLTSLYTPVKPEDRAPVSARMVVCKATWRYEY